MRRIHWKGVAGLAALIVATACGAEQRSSTAAMACDPDNGGITLPDGFCATVFADLPARPRHLVVRENGDVFVAAYPPGRDTTGGGVYALRDSDGDGHADSTTRFGPGPGGSGIALADGHLWLAMNGSILRFALGPEELSPAGEAETIVSGLPADRSHTAKSIALSKDGRLFVNIGSPTNSCQAEDRQDGSKGIDPCPQLENRAGIWSFDAGRTGQVQADGERFATGIRNGVAIAVNPDNGRLFAIQHGRDQLAANWRSLFNDQQSAEKPAEELFAVDQGDDFGWPYCYYDPELGMKVLAPEYGGDGHTAGRCADKEGPLFAFPAHWAPDGLLFYRGDQFPARYREGVFIAFHGSWNRAPEPQGGYKVVFLPFNAGAPLTSFEVFADGFAGAVMQPGEAEHRPVGLAQAPDGSIYVTDDTAGRVWRIVYRVPRT
jgi:glucose/arabinose dehydrogenase